MKYVTTQSEKNKVKNSAIRHRSVLLYVPNIICYFRFFLLIIASIYILKSPLITLAILSVGVCLDAFDGYFARKLKQTSFSGAIFDLIVDRLYTTLYMCGLGILYINYWTFFLALLFLDIASHFAQLYILSADKITNHKTSNHSNSYLLGLYYNNRLFLFFICGFYDAWLAIIYLKYSYPTLAILDLGFLLFLPGFITKVIIHVIQFIEAIKYSILVDLREQHDHSS